MQVVDFLPGCRNAPSTAHCNIAVGIRGLHPRSRCALLLPSLTGLSRGPTTVPPTMVAISGGVDSAVALMQLVEAGVPVQAMFMKNWEEDDRDGHCAAADDLADAQRVCDRLGVALHAVNCSDTYWDKVFVQFIRDIENGMTPNPDVTCNREVKFAAFVDHARRFGAERVATGHYARLRRTVDAVRLLKGVDPAKDQSYFLHALDQSQLARAVFPLGELHKHTVRAMARKGGLAPHDKPDSTGLCFVGERRFPPFLARFVDAAPGPVETEDGVCIGEHPGLAFFTIGQRRGLGIGGRNDSAQAPWYVAGEGPRAQCPGRRSGTRSSSVAFTPAACARRALDRGSRTALTARMQCEDSISPDRSALRGAAGGTRREHSGVAVRESAVGRRPPASTPCSTLVTNASGAA